MRPFPSHRHVYLIEMPLPGPFNHSKVYGVAAKYPLTLDDLHARLLFGRQSFMEYVAEIDPYKEVLYDADGAPILRVLYPLFILHLVVMDLVPAIDPACDLVEDEVFPHGTTPLKFSFDSFVRMP